MRRLGAIFAQRIPVMRIPDHATTSNSPSPTGDSKNEKPERILKFQEVKQDASPDQ
jgi:hypothetical protein